MSFGPLDICLIRNSYEIKNDLRLWLTSHEQFRACQGRTATRKWWFYFLPERNKTFYHVIFAAKIRAFKAGHITHCKIKLPSMNCSSQPATISKSCYITSTFQLIWCSTLRRNTVTWQCFHQLTWPMSANLRRLVLPSAHVSNESKVMKVARLKNMKNATADPICTAANLASSSLDPHVGSLQTTPGAMRSSRRSIFLKFATLLLLRVVNVEYSLPLSLINSPKFSSRTGRESLKIPLLLAVKIASSISLSPHFTACLPCSSSRNREGSRGYESAAIWTLHPRRKHRRVVCFWASWLTRQLLIQGQMEPHTTNNILYSSIVQHFRCYSLYIACIYTLTIVLSATARRLEWIME